MHTWAWLSWLAAVVVVLSTTRNPWALVLVIMCLAFVSLALRRSRAAQPMSLPVWRFALLVITLAAAFNALTSHYGATKFYTIPGRIPLLSGPVTLEALVYGVINGLVLSGLLAAFNVLNQALPVRALVRLIPRAFYPLAVVTSIAVTYIPTTIRQARQIREAQAVRGHQVRSLGDWLPLLMPMLVGGLEHAMQLAEAMTARGFATTPFEQPRYRTPSRLAMLLGLILLSAGWLWRLSGRDGFGLGMLALGAGLIGWGFWRLGKQAPRTSYHQESWGMRDSLVLCSALLVLGAFLLPIPGLGKEALWYNPYPSLTLPSFGPLAGLILLGLTLPGWLSLKAG